MRTTLAAYVLAITLLGAAVSSGATDLRERVKDSDVIVLGYVVLITKGELDPDALKRGLNMRTDIAAVRVLDVLKGDPSLRKVEVGFPGFPQPGRLRLRRNQHGILLLTRGSHKYYEAKSTDRFLPKDELRSVRRAVRAVAGLPSALLSPAAQARRIAQLRKQLSAERTGTRMLAAHKLGNLGEVGTIPALIAALNDKAPAVRLTADVALRKITGRRTRVDFQRGTDTARSRGIKAWQAWWRKNGQKKRQDILYEAANASARPQGDFRYAIEGLAQYRDMKLRPLFLDAFDSALNAKDSTLLIATAKYLARIEDRASIRKLASLLDGSLEWLPSRPARSAAAAAIGSIVGRDFGTGSDALKNCTTWWRRNRDRFP